VSLLLRKGGGGEVLVSFWVDVDAILDRWGERSK